MTRRALLVDDEPPARRRLRQLLAAHPEVTVVAEAGSLTRAADEYRAARPDLIFLDIQLGQELAFGLFDRCEVDADVIFVTAYSQHAVRAFEVNALDYLLKPIEPERLALALARRRRGPSSEAPTPLVERDVLSLRSAQGWRFVDLADVARIAAHGDYTEVFVEDGSTVLSDLRMTDWIGRLPPAFVRIHRSHIVCTARVCELVKRGHGWEVSLTGSDVALPVGRSRLGALRDALGL